MSKLGDRMGSKLGREARSILEAGRAGDDPTPADRARVKRALMRSIAAGGAIGATAAAASAGAAQGGAVGAATGGAAAAKAASVGLGIKLFGGVVLALAVGTGVLVQRASPSDPAPAVAAPSAAALATEGAAPPALSPPALSPPVLSPPVLASAAAGESGDPLEAPYPRPFPPRSGEREESSRSSKARAPSPPLAPEIGGKGSGDRGPPEDPLAAETRRLREAHSALRAGDPQKALALLGEQGGQLGEERAAARVLALCQMGRVAEAEAARAAFLREHPRSPLAARIQGGCAPSIAR